MKKIILAFDGTHFSEGAFEFARRLNVLQPILLTGVFLPQTDLANLWSYADGAGTVFIPMLESSESELVQQNIDRFEKLCQANGIDYRIHRDFFDFAIPELKKESRYADLLILGSEMFYESMGTNSPNDYLRDALQDVKCPVLLVPEKFDFPESIILAYDGSEDSVFAIKQFAYLFPELTDRETLLVYANTNAEEDFPDKIQIEELAARHFSNLTLFKLDVNPKKHFTTWITEKKSAMLVSGSYGRSGLSQLFKKSFVREVIADHRLPVFIAHK
jgi:nucleotide-binding universal stress UspA family protein